MSSKALVKNIVTTLYRKNPHTGYIESVEFVGTLKLKPKGWTVRKPEYKHPVYKRKK